METGGITFNRDETVTLITVMYATILELKKVVAEYIRMESKDSTIRMLLDYNTQMVQEYELILTKLKESIGIR